MTDQLHPILAALFRELPPVGSEWPAEERVRWLRALAAAADWVYKNDDAAKLKIEVKAPHPEKTDPGRVPEAEAVPGCTVEE